MTTDSEVETNPARLRWLLGVAGVLALVAAIVWWPGCRQYPPVSSAESLKAMKQLYSACNKKDPAMIDALVQRLDKLRGEGSMPVKERESFDRIIAMAQAGDWKRAEDAAFRFAQDQVGAKVP